MTDWKEYLPCWPGWETVRRIGQGDIGAVFEIERDVSGNIEHAALKVISIPQNEDEIDELLDSGYDIKSITTRYRNDMQEIMQSYSLMAEMKDCASIVYFDDVKREQHKDNVGWDILIKTELLTPLMNTVKESISDDEVIQLGMSMCNALICCEQRGVLHRNIKPENMFVSDDGIYKLGDCGVAKWFHHANSHTKTDMDEFMAPEIYNNQPYDHRSDLYSLGLVLYWLLNEQRLPFMPLPPRMPTVEDQEEACYRRFHGEKLPPPKHGNEKIKAIVMKACAYNPSDRFRDAVEMNNEFINNSPPSVWHCWNCGKLNPETSESCGGCGKPRVPPNGWKCAYCGTSNSNSTKNCSSCGKPRKSPMTKWLLVAAIAAVVAISAFLIWHQSISIIPEIPSAEITRSMGPFSSGWFTFVNGASVNIPNGFMDINNTGDYQSGLDVDGYWYRFYNDDYKMEISLSEAKMDSYLNTGRYGTTEYEVLKTKYDNYIKLRGEPDGSILTENWFKLTGHWKNQIYYTYAVLNNNDIVYILDFLYPSSNSDDCNPIVESVESSFSETPGAIQNKSTYHTNPVANPPTLRDLEIMATSSNITTKSNTGVDLVLPGEQEMLNTPFRARIDNGSGSGSIYIMPKPKSGNGYLGTVTTNTDVWIVAETEYYYFFVTDDGWLGWNGKNYFK